MQRIITLIQKLNQLTRPGNKLTTIDVDLMLDYTRVMYADLLELRAQVQPQADETTSNVEEPLQKPIEQKKEVEVSTSENIFSFNEQVEFKTSDVRSAIGINDKYLYISELFNSDKSTYDEVLNQLNTFSNYQSAAAWVSNELFNKYGWSEDSDAVQSFYNMLSNFFSSK